MAKLNQLMESYHNYLSFGSQGNLILYTADHFLLKTTELKLSSETLTQDTRFYRSYLAVKSLDHLPIPTLFT